MVEKLNLKHVSNNFETKALGPPLSCDRSTSQKRIKKQGVEKMKKGEKRGMCSPVSTRSVHSAS